MKLKQTLIFLIAFVVAPVWFAHAQKSRSALPRVHIFTTGGTIAGQERSDGSGGYDAGKLAIDAILDSVPEIREFARVKGKAVAQIGSQDMNDKVWLVIAREVQAALARRDITGVVITHGTDTLEETAFFLDHVIASNKPVVMVGSMRPATSRSADGPINLHNAIRLAASPEARGRGCLVVMNDIIHSARDVVKMHTTRVDTFQSPNTGAVGHFFKNKPVFWNQPGRRALRFNIRQRNKLPRVEIVYAHANMTELMIDAAVSGKAAGIVVAGVGNGNLSAPAMAALDRARASGVTIVRSSRVGAGRVDRNVEINDDAKGFIAAGMLNPQKARILLILALTPTKDLKEIQKFFFAR